MCMDAILLVCCCCCCGGYECAEIRGCHSPPLSLTHSLTHSFTSLLSYCLTPCTFQNSLRQHGQHVQQRESRVTKFGQGSDQVRRGQASFPPPSLASSSSSSSSQQQGQQLPGVGGYALFARPPIAAGGEAGQVAPPRPSGRNQGVIRRRNNAGAPPAPASSGSSGSSASGSGTVSASASSSPLPPRGSVDETNNSQSAADKGRSKYFSVAFPTYGSDQQDQQLQQQHQRRNNVHRSEQSKMVEESIGKVSQVSAR